MTSLGLLQMNGEVHKDAFDFWWDAVATATTDDWTPLVKQTPANGARPEPESSGNCESSANASAPVEPPRALGAALLRIFPICEKSESINYLQNFCKYFFFNKELNSSHNQMRLRSGFICTSCSEKWRNATYRSCKIFLP